MALAFRFIFDELSALNRSKMAAIALYDPKSRMVHPPVRVGSARKQPGVVDDENHALEGEEPEVRPTATILFCPSGQYRISHPPPRALVLTYLVELLAQDF